MIVGISFYDVVKLPEFSKLSIFDLLRPEMDSKVAPYLWEIGADIDKPVKVQACQHRTLDGAVRIGYRYVYPERTDYAWTRSSGCSMAGRIAAQKDKHLASDMVRLSTQGTSWSSYQLMVIRAAGQEGMTYDEKQQQNEEVEASTGMMHKLREIQISIRGHLSIDEDTLNVIDSKY